MENEIFDNLPPPDNMTLGYMEWRDTVAQRNEALLVALRRLTISELYAAYERLIGGLTAERLNPDMSHGNFHLAAGIIRGLLVENGVSASMYTIDEADYVPTPPHQNPIQE